MLDSNEDVRVIDVRDEPHGLGAKNRRRYYRGARKAKGVCFHHTGVHGGFGTHRSVRRLYDGDAPDVKARALGHRYRGMPRHLNKKGAQPYHAIWNEYVQAMYYVHPFDRMTWHGNGANREFLGFAWDARSGKVGDDFDLSGAQNAVRRLVLDALAEGHPIREFTCHCAWTNKPSDPGAQFIELVIEPLAAELQVEIDWEFKRRGGRSMAEILANV